MFKYSTVEFYCQLFYYIFQKNFTVTFPQGYSQKTKIFSRCYLGKKYVPRSGAASCNTAHLIQSTKRLRGRIGEKNIYKKKLFHQITVLCSLQRVLASFLALKTSLTALRKVIWPLFLCLLNAKQSSILFGINSRPSRQSPINFWNKLPSPSKNNAPTINRQRSFSLWESVF